MPRILLLDADQFFRRAVRSYLADSHQLAECARCAEADAALEEKRAELIIFDGLLPDGNGLEWLMERREAGDATAALLCSAFWQRGNPLKGLGRAEALPKPVKASEFLGVVKRLLAPPEISAPVTSVSRETLASLQATVKELKAAPYSPALLSVARRSVRSLGGAGTDLEQALKGLDWDRIDALLSQLSR